MIWNNCILNYQNEKEEILSLLGVHDAHQFATNLRELITFTIIKSHEEVANYHMLRCWHAVVCDWGKTELVNGNYFFGKEKL